MPTYEYRCTNGHDFEDFVLKMSAAKMELPCPTCGERGARRMSAGGGLLFKGSGFYITDYGKDGKKAAAAPGKPDSGRSEGSSSEGARAEGGKSDGAKAEGGKSEGGRSEGGRSEGGKAEGGKSNGGRAEGGKSDSARADAPKAEKAKTEAKATGSASSTPPKGAE